jgi:hypothetical protein
MLVYFQKFKDPILILTEDKENKPVPIKKTGNIFNNYTRGDFIIVGGRKHQEKSSLFYITM